MERRPPSLSLWQRVESRPTNVPSVDFNTHTLLKRGPLTVSVRHTSRFLSAFPFVISVPRVRECRISIVRARICWSLKLASVGTSLTWCEERLFLTCFAYKMPSQSQSLSSSGVPAGKKKIQTTNPAVSSTVSGKPGSVTLMERCPVGLRHSSHVSELRIARIIYTVGYSVKSGKRNHSRCFKQRRI